MSNLRRIDWFAAVRLAKYSHGIQDLVCETRLSDEMKNTLAWQPNFVQKVSELKELGKFPPAEVYTDSDLASNRTDYRSTSGIVVTWWHGLGLVEQHPGRPPSSVLRRSRAEVVVQRSV